MLRRLFACCICVFAAVFSSPASCADTAAQSPKIDEERLEQALHMTEQKFGAAYRELWKQHDLDSIVIDSIDRAVARSLENVSHGFRWFYLMSMNDNDEMMKRIEYSMNEAYDKMIADLEKRFSVILEDQVKYFYQITVLEASAADAPMRKAFVRSMAMSALKAQRLQFLDTVQKSIGKQETLVRIAKDTAMAAAVSLSSHFFKERLAEVILKKFVGSSAKGLLTSLNVVSWGYAIYDITNSLSQKEANLKEDLKAHLKRLYTYTMPSLYWEAMRAQVEEVFRSTAKKIELDRALAAKLAGNPDIDGLIQNLSEQGKGTFFSRIAMISRSLELDVSRKSFLSEWGSVIRDCPESRFSTLQRLLAGNREQAGKWFKYLGNDYYDFLELLPEIAWKKFSPGEKSAKALQWCLAHIPAHELSRVFELSRESIEWLGDGLLPDYLPDLLTEKKSISEIESEIQRLSRFYPKETRKPWKTTWGGWFKDFFDFGSLEGIAHFLAAVLIIISGPWCLGRFVSFCKKPDLDFTPSPVFFGGLFLQPLRLA